MNYLSPKFHPQGVSLGEILGKEKKMKDRLDAIGNYINDKSGKKINFKGIKADRVYRGLLFTYMGEDYIISDSKDEVIDVLWKMSAARSEDYNKKDAKRYTHIKFKKAKEKKVMDYSYKRKAYFVVEL